MNGNRYVSSIESSVEIGAHPWLIFETQSLGGHRVGLVRITSSIANDGGAGKVVFHSVKSHWLLEFLSDMA